MKYLLIIFLWNFVYAQDDGVGNGLDDLPQIDRYGEDGKGTLSESLKKENVIIKYKSEEYFDFDALQVQGEIITPADLSSRANKRVRFNIKDHIRKDFDDFIREDLIDIH